MLNLQKSCHNNSAVSVPCTTQVPRVTILHNQSTVVEAKKSALEHASHWSTGPLRFSPALPRMSFFWSTVQSRPHSTRCCGGSQSSRLWLFPRAPSTFHCPWPWPFGRLLVTRFVEHPAFKGLPAFFSWFELLQLWPEWHRSEVPSREVCDVTHYWWWHWSFLVSMVPAGFIHYTACFSFQINFLVQGTLRKVPLKVEL